MADLVVIVPSRERPDSAAQLAQAFTDTCRADTSLLFAVDQHDPALAGYQSVGDGRRSAVLFTPSTSMVQALNCAAQCALAGEPLALGFMGDDHRPRTVGWDVAYLDALHELGTGIVYGDDLMQGERLATQCAMTADIVRALGYMAPPQLTHLYVDDAWMAWGRDAGCLRYLPQVVVEHLHPAAGKAQLDAGYERVNALYGVDGQAFADYRATGLAGDVAKIAALRAAGVPS